MKIAIVTPGGVDRSGIERVIPCLLWLVERLVKCGDEVHIFALRQEALPGKWPLLGAKVHNAGGTNPLSRGARMLASLHAEHRRVPFDVIHALWAVPQGTLAAVARRTLGIPMLLHLPGGDVVRLPEINYGARMTAMGRLALRIAVSAADRIVAPSAAMVRQSQALGIRAERIPFGVALDHWPAIAPRRRVDGAPLRLLHVANLSPVKDQQTLLAAAGLLGAQGIKFDLDIVGEDTLHGSIQRRTRELGLTDQIRFHGFLQQSVLRKHMCAADLLVVTSRHEAGPIVALEAAACGVPTVGTNVGLLVEWAPKAACVVDVGDSVALAAAIADLSSNEDRRLELASEAQELAIAENADVTTQRIRDLYMAMTEERGKPVAARGWTAHAPGNGTPRRLRNS